MAAAFDAAAGGDGAATGHVAAGPGRLGAHAGGRESGPPTAACGPLPRRSLVATVPVGYADGVPRALLHGGCGVLIGGRRRPLAGTVTMDQIMVDCGDDTSVAPGDEVVLLGRQGDEEITADEWAELLGHHQLRGPVRHRPAGAPGHGQGARSALGGSVHRRRWPERWPSARRDAGASAPRGTGVHQVPAGRMGGPRSSSAWETPAPSSSSWARGPGREEDLAGEPFVGRSGKLLDRLMWEEIGLTRGAVLHRQRGEVPAAAATGTRPRGEIEACRPYLEEQIAPDRPDGHRHPGQLRHPPPARQRRGHPAAARGGRTPTARASSCPTYHPAYVLRAGGEAVAEMRADLVRAKRLMAGDGERDRERWPVAVRSRFAGRDHGRWRPAWPRLCRPGDVVLLIGDLGAGKTAFAQGFAAGLGVAGPVTSPTFTLVRQYRCGPGPPCRDAASRRRLPHGLPARSGRPGAGRTGGGAAPWR